MGFYDYVVVIFYLAFMFLLGPVYKSFSKTSSDFFRGGGGMLWWVVGASAFMNIFTAWAFTGGAGKIYETGTFYLLLFGCNWIAMWFGYFFVVAKYRQMRIITVMEGVYKRYGVASEQFLNWVLILTRTIYGGLALYTLAVFMSSVFGINMAVLIIGLGIIVTLMTVFGGSWAATAGDFVQMIMVTVITIAMAVLTLIKMEGIDEFLQSIPKHHLNWTLFERPSVIFFFAVTLLINQTVQMNSLIEGAAKYIFVKNGRDAKKAILIPLTVGTLLTLMWLIPPMAATIFHPDLATEYPQLNHPSEAAYVAMAKDLLPEGLLGLLVCGIFAATVTSYNSLLNIISGNFVRNFYIRIVKPTASEKEQIFVGRITMLIYGAIWIFTGLLFLQYKSLTLFDLVLIIAASIGLPLAVPLFLGIFFKRTPSWAGWGTMLAGFIVSIMLRFILDDEFIKTLWQSPDLNPREIGDLNIAITTAVVAAASFGFFFLSMLFYNEKDKKYVQQVENFFKEIHTPVSEDENELSAYDSDARQYNVLGNLCMIYGGFILLLILIPNSFGDRFLTFCCGGFIFVVGAILRAIGISIRKKIKTGDLFVG